VHLILDNYGTHTHPKVTEWLAARPRYHLHFTPTSASWLNLVERFLAEITERRIRRGTFRSLPELIRAITTYIRERNKKSQTVRLDRPTQGHHPQGAKSAPLFREFRSGTLVELTCPRFQ
jgi:transposase